MDGGWFICTKKKLGRGINRVGLAWLGLACNPKH